MKNIIFIISFFVFSLSAFSQEYNMDSLSNAIVNANSDSDRNNQFAGVFMSTVWNNPDWTVRYSRNILLT
ncbi:MAG TPA: hypothetical protein VGH64_06125, partial [Puia sp.]